MSYARRAALAGAVLLGVALGVRAQDSSTEPKSDDATLTDSASPSDVSTKSARSSQQRPGRSGYRTGNDATESNTAENEATSRRNTTKTGDPVQATPRRTPIAPDDRRIQLNFRTEPWDNVLDWIAELSGLALQIEAKPQGTFNYINDPQKYTLAEVMDILNLQLKQQKITLIRHGNYLHVIDLSNGISPELIPPVRVEDLSKYGKSQFVKVFIPLKNVPAKSAADDLNTFKSETGTIKAMEGQNRLMITDTVANILLMHDYLNQIETDPSAQSKMRWFELKYASASKVEAELRDLLGLPARQAPAPQGQRTGGSERGADEWRERMERMRRMMEAGGGPNPFMMFGGQPGGDSRGERGDRGSDARDRRDQQQPANTVTTTVDEPRNILFVKAPPDILAMVEGFVAQVDVPRPGMDPFKPREPQTPVVKPYRLSDGDAQSLANALNAIYQNTPGVRISADQGNNMVVVVATPDDQEQIAKLVEQFEYDERNSVVLPLSVLDAGSVETLLISVYSSGQRDWRGNAVPRPGQPRVVADRSRNQLAIRGSKKQVDDIRSMLAALGEPQLSPISGNSTLQIIPLSTADQLRFEEFVRKMWPVVRPNNNRIEVINLGNRPRGDEQPARESAQPEPTDDPRRRGVPRSVETDSEEQPPARARPKSSTDQPNRTSRDRRPAMQLVSYVEPGSIPQDRDEEGASKSPLQQRDEPQPKHGEGAPVVLSFGEGNVVVGSSDPEAIQRLLHLLDLFRGGSRAGGAEYRVFYLDSADATQMQLTLNDLLGISSLASFFGGSSATTSTLKIVPDARTNSLIVYGNTSDLAKVEELIKVLDSSDAPASGAMSSPRIIPVRNANAISVARVVRDVYSTRVVSGTGGFGGFGGPSNFGGFNPGGFSGGAPTSNTRSNRSTQGSLSIGVDEQSNSIVVACSEALFQEVKKLVAELDVAASETQRTVQIVTLKNSTPSAVTEALNGLMGISSTSTNGSTRSRSGSGFDPSSRNFGGSQFGGPMGTSFGGFPVGSPFGTNFFGRGPDGGSFDRGRFFGSGSPNFGGDRGDFGGDRGRDRDRGGDRGRRP